MSITVDRISKTFGDFKALDDISLEVPANQLVALLGPSGSGKTTLLRILAGLDRPDPGSGAIRFQEEDVVGRRVQDRRVGFVFQHYALFRHMTVFENVAFGLRVRPRSHRPSPADIRDRVHRLLRLVQLDGLADRNPAQLSGGQRQRVALARALAVRPRVLLLDEPFGALDAQVRKQLRSWLRELHREIKVTSVFVTHDQDEALEVADQVVVMNAGRIEQVGTPDAVFHGPATEFVMNFLGEVNVFEGTCDGEQVSLASLCLEAGGTDPLHGPAAARIFIRPHELDLAMTPPPGGSLPGRVEAVNSAGPAVRLVLRVEEGVQVVAGVSQDRFRELNIRCGDQVHLIPRRWRVFPAREREETVVWNPV